MRLSFGRGCSILGLANANRLREEPQKILLVIQLSLYCLLFFLMVKAAVKDNGMNCLYFYPPAFIDEAARRGLADKDETMKRLDDAMAKL